MYKFLPILLFAYGLAITTEEIYDNSYALIIGIDKYENVKNLDYAVDDANSIRSLLIEQFNFPPENITLLVNEKATYTKIKKSLSYVTRQASENDRILIFFAGHGETIDLPESGEMGFLIPVDGEKGDLYGTSLEMDELRKVSSLSKAKHILYLVDACYGGLAAINARALDVSSTGFIDKITRNKSRQIITAGGRGEPVIEKAEWGHSAFTLNVLRGLRDWNADLNMDGIITADELGLFLKEKVTVDSENQQTPQSRRFTSHEGEFVFINNMYIENQNVNISSNVKNDNLTDIMIESRHSDSMIVSTFKKEIRRLKEELNKPVKFIQGCTDKTAINYNSEANIDDNSCIILHPNAANIRLGELVFKYPTNSNETTEILLDIFIETGEGSLDINNIEFKTNGFRIKDIIDGIIQDNRFNKIIDGLYFSSTTDLSNSFNSNNHEILLLKASIIPSSNFLCVDNVHINSNSDISRFGSGFSIRLDCIEKERMYMGFEDIGYWSDEEEGFIRFSYIEIFNKNESTIIDFEISHEISANFDYNLEYNIYKTNFMEEKIILDEKKLYIESYDEIVGYLETYNYSIKQTDLMLNGNTICIEGTIIYNEDIYYEENHTKSLYCIDF